MTILKRENNFLTVVGTGGDSTLGGEDFTNKVVDDALNVIGQPELRNNTKFMAQLHKVCEKIKVTLSATPTEPVQIVLPNDTIQEYNITKIRFRHVSCDLIKRMKECINAALNSADLQSEDIEEVLLVGGASRTDGIVDMLKKIFPDKAIIPTLNVDEDGKC